MYKKKQKESEDRLNVIMIEEEYDKQNCKDQYKMNKNLLNRNIQFKGKRRLSSKVNLTINFIKQ
jgi:hypothetical protein